MIMNGHANFTSEMLKNPPSKKQIITTVATIINKCELIWKNVHAASKNRVDNKYTMKMSTACHKLATNLDIVS